MLKLGPVRLAIVVAPAIGCGLRKNGCYRHRAHQSRVRAAPFLGHASRSSRGSSAASPFFRRRRDEQRKTSFLFMIVRASLPTR